MPFLSFFANGLWVLVMGILGPSIPAIVEDLGITYVQAGIFFTLLSLGSLLGTSFGAALSDFLNRKRLFLIHCFCLFAGLIITALSGTYLTILVSIFFMSLLGSPVGALGQSIMLSLFPEKRERNLALQTSVAALGSFLSPLIVSLVLVLGITWRGSFYFAAFGVLILFFSGIRVPQVERKEEEKKSGRFTLLKDKKLLFTAFLVFISVGPDIGFSYWLSEHFKTDLQVSLRLSSAVVSIYLAGVVISRALVPLLLKKLRPSRILFFGTLLASVSLLIFCFLPLITVKTFIIFFYGLGIGPIFPLLIARGTKLYPKNPGIATGILFAGMSLGGMLLPLVIGSLAQYIGIAKAYSFNLLLLVFLGLVNLREV